MLWSVRTTIICPPAAGVSAALARAAGRQVERERHELVQQRHPRLGEVVRTSAGALPCNHLYHAITIDFDRGKRMDEASLRLLVANLLDRATADGVQSLGIPALGTGAAIFDLGHDGERSVYFVDERGKTRTVRADERIDARRHYYCFATNNPVYLFPTLIPKT